MTWLCVVYLLFNNGTFVKETADTTSEKDCHDKAIELQLGLHDKYNGDPLTEHARFMTACFMRGDLE